MDRKQIFIRFCDNIAQLLIFKKGTSQPLPKDSIQILQPCRAISRRHSLLTTKSVGVPGTLLIDLTMKSPRGFEPANTGLVTGKHLIISLFFHSNKVVYKGFKI